MKFLEYLNEVYIDIVADHRGLGGYPIFKNPTASDLKDLKSSCISDTLISDTLIRFILTNTDIYVTPYTVIHPILIKKLNLGKHVLFRGSGNIKGNKIDTEELRYTKEMTKDSLKIKFPWEKYFIDWDSAVRGAYEDASVL